jgi:hypothetical protein
MLIGNGKRFNVTATGTVTKSGVWAASVRAGVYMKSGVVNDVVPVALSGIFELTKSAAASTAFAVGQKVYAVASTGVITNSTTGHPVLGVAVALTSSDATSVRVRLES